VVSPQLSLLSSSFYVECSGLIHENAVLYYTLSNIGGGKFRPGEMRSKLSGATVLDCKRLGSSSISGSIQSI
jgi:hypothetical protein